MRVAILVPRRSDGGRRDLLWDWVRNWMTEHHPYWTIYEGFDDGADKFSMSRARNQAAKAAGAWDVAVIVDADTIAPPWAVAEAVRKAHVTGTLCVAGDMRMRMDQVSSDLIIDSDQWFPRPEGKRHPKDGVITDMCYGEPSSGVIAVPRKLWNATGGYLEALKGWGWEDLCFITQCYIVGSRMQWVRNSMLLHFWHPRTPEDEDTHSNYAVWDKLHHLSTHDRKAAKDYLRELGHPW